MRQSFKKPWVMTGLALLGAMIAAGHECRAGISITGGFAPATGDPPYDYIFQVYSSSAIKSGDYFTINKLVGVTLGSFFQPDDKQPNNWTPPLIVQTSFSWTDPTVGTSNVSWAYCGPTLNNPPANQPIYLGQFEIETTQNFSSGTPVPAGTSITYSYSVDGGTVTASSSFPIANLSVPEPASSTIVLLIGGTAALSGLVVRARRHRSARPA